LKVFARADRELKRRFSTVFAQFDTILGSFRSATEKGPCPMASYISAVIRCLDLAAQTSQIVKSECVIKVINAFFAPRGLGGWGMPHVSCWLTQETPDELVSYITTMSTFYEVARDDLIKQSICNILDTTLRQELAEPDILQILRSPRTVFATGVQNPTGAINSRKV
jgi:hypothetical protein